MCACMNMLNFFDEYYCFVVQSKPAIFTEKKNESEKRNILRI